MDHPDAPVLAARRRPDATAPQILVVDDQTDWTHVVTAVLREQEWCVRDAIDGADAVTQAERFNPDLVLLDILLPDIDGPEVARRIRARRPDTRVLFLTACDVLDVEIPPGEAYLTKPVALEDIIVRLQAMLQHLSIDQPDDGLVPATRRLAVSDLVMDEKQRTVWRGDQLLELNSEEFALLRFLMHNPGRVISATEIFEQIWSMTSGPTPTPSSCTSAICVRK